MKVQTEAWEKLKKARENAEKDVVDEEAIEDTRLRVIVVLLRGKLLQGVGSRPQCAKCGTEERAMMCQCGLVYYCGPDCQKIHWDVHQHEHTLQCGTTKFQRLLAAGTKTQVLGYLLQQGVRFILSCLMTIAAQIAFLIIFAYFALGGDKTLENWHYLSMWLNDNLSVYLPPLKHITPAFMWS